MAHYPIRLTRLARAFAEAKYGGVATIEDMARKEIDAEDINLSEPFLLTLTMSENPETNIPEIFIIVADPQQEGAVLIDTGHFEEGPKLDKGPFAGKTMMMPVADSDETN